MTRLGGASRLATATRISQAAYPAADSARAVVLARADAFADGLAGTPLAAALGGPLLLSASDHLDTVTRDEIARVLPDGGRVVLLGGPAALSDEVAAAVEEAGFAAERVQGPTRYDTAVAIARRVSGLVDLQTTIVARGDDFPDALAAGPAAAASAGVVLLSDGDQPHPATQAWLDDHPDLDLVAVGGPAARAHPDAREVSGATREATAVAVAEAFLPDATGTGVARRDGFADALTGGVHAAAQGLPVLLTAQDDLPRDTAAHVDGSAIDRAVVFGGTSAISEDVVRQLEQRLS